MSRSIATLVVHLPKLNGHGVLREVKTNEALRTIPVVMLTTSDRVDEIQAAYNEGANSYVSKPMDFWQFSERIRTLKQYWVRTSELPAA